MEMDPKVRKRAEACLRDAKRIEAQLFRAQAAALRLAARMTSVSKSLSDKTSFTSAAACIEECRGEVIESVEFMATYWELPNPVAEGDGKEKEEQGS